MMKKIPRSFCAASVLALCIASALPTAYASTDGTGQTLTFTPNANETSMLLQWVPPPDSFGPRPPCNLVDYTVNLYNDNTLVQTFNEQNAPLSDASGQCIFQKTIVSGAAYTDKVSPGIWYASATKTGSPQIWENRAIYACTATQGKSPMYWTRNNSYTDNFYTTSASQRDISINYGNINRGVPFSMPSRVLYDNAWFYRYYKGVPQFEHFYTYSNTDAQIVEQNGYKYEGVEGAVFKKYKPGTVALYRYALFNGANSDLQHYYTITPNDPAAAGWGYDGVVGYVCTP